MRCCIDDYTIAKIRTKIKNVTVFPITSIFIDRIASGVIEILRSFIVREKWKQKQ